MKNQRRVLAGKRSQAKGKQFEAFVESALAKQGWTVIRIPDGAVQIGANKVKRIKSPFDFLAIQYGEAIVFDTKTTSSERIPMNLFPKHQQDELKRCKNAGAFAGFLVHIETTGDIVWVDACLKKSVIIGAFPNLTFNLRKIIVSLEQLKQPPPQIDPQLGTE